MNANLILAKLGKLLQGVNRAKTSDKNQHRPLPSNEHPNIWKSKFCFVPAMPEVTLGGHSRGSNTIQRCKIGTRPWPGNLELTLRLIMCKWKQSACDGASTLGLKYMDRVNQSPKQRVPVTPQKADLSPKKLKKNVCLTKYQISKREMFFRRSDIRTWTNDDSVKGRSSRCKFWSESDLICEKHYPLQAWSNWSTNWLTAMRRTMGAIDFSGTIAQCE